MNTNKKNNMNKYITAGAALFAVIIVVILYQSLVIIPKEKIEAEKESATLARNNVVLQEKNRTEDYELCISDSWTEYSEDWENQCVIQKKELDCNLTDYESQTVETRYASSKKTCLEIYKAN